MRPWRPSVRYAFLTTPDRLDRGDVACGPKGKELTGAVPEQCTTNYLVGHCADRGVVRSRYDTRVHWLPHRRYRIFFDDTLRREFRHIGAVVTETVARSGGFH